VTFRIDAPHAGHVLLLTRNSGRSEPLVVLYPPGDTSPRVGAGVTDLPPVAIITRIEPPGGAEDVFAFLCRDPLGKPEIIDRFQDFVRLGRGLPCEYDLFAMSSHGCPEDEP
jgi:hypothetical protein